MKIKKLLKIMPFGILIFVIALLIGQKYYSDQEIRQGNPAKSILLQPFFIANRGQIPENFDFQTRSNGGNIYFNSQESVIDIGNCKTENKCENIIIKRKLLKSNPKAELITGEQLPGKVNYFLGENSEKWQTNIPTFSSFTYKNVYPGINLLHKTENNNIKYEYILNPGARTSDINFEFEGLEASIDDGGNILLKQGKTDYLFEEKPFIYQEVNGIKNEISGKYVLSKNNQASFSVGKYDPNLTLYIDPQYAVIQFSTYLGGAGDESMAKVSFDSAGNIIVAGQTTSVDFPTSSPLQADNSGDKDIVITKLSADGSSIIFSTYFGGAGEDSFSDLATDSSDNIHFTGYTSSIDYPKVNNFQAELNSVTDAFITKINSSGDSVLYSTPIGGENDDKAHGIGINSTDQAIISGETISGTFPLLNPIYPTLQSKDIFVTRFGTDGTLSFSTYISGNGVDIANDLDIDAAGNIYLTGQSNSSDLATIGPANINVDAFVTKINPSTPALSFFRYIGGTTNDIDSGKAIALDSAENIYIGGDTESEIFSTVNGYEGYNNVSGSNIGLFVAKFSPDASSVIYASRLNGQYPEYLLDLVVDSNGSIIISGQTYNNNFPELNSRIPENNYPTAGFLDMGFILKFSPSGNTLDYSIHLNEEYPNTEVVTGLTIDSNNLVYTTGYTQSSEYILRNPLYNSNSGGMEFFLSTIKFDQEPEIISHILTPDSTIPAEELLTFSTDWSDADDSQVKMWVCNGNLTNSITSTYTTQIVPPSCASTTWCTSDWTNSSPASCSFSPPETLSGNQNYYIYICDEDYLCDSTNGSFTVLPISPAAETLYANNNDAQSGQVNPVNIIDSTLVFSAVCNDPNGDDVNQYDIEVADNAGFLTSIWSSTAPILCNDGNRTQDIAYAGPAIAQDGSTYYWRIRFWDTNGNDGAWSNAQFTIYNFINTAPDQPLNLFVNNTNAQTGSANPNGIFNLTPAMSAICNDPDTGDILVKYKIQVDDNNNFSTPLWNTSDGGTNMNICNTGNRSEDIIYAGDPLDQYETIYYWRIKFWDDEDNESPWSDTNTFTMYNDNLPPKGNLTIESTTETTSTATVNLTLRAWDLNGGQTENNPPASGVLSYQLSNDGMSWTPDFSITQPYTNGDPILHENWDLNDVNFGGSNIPGTKSVYVRFKDQRENHSLNPAISTNTFDLNNSTLNQTQVNGGVLELEASGQLSIGNWTNGGSVLPQASVGGGAVEINDKIYVIAGADGSWAPSNSVQIYDTNTQIWSTGTPINVGSTDYMLMNFSIAAIGTDIYALGGRNGNWLQSSEVLKYNTLTDTWSLVNPIPDGFERESAATAVYNGIIYLIGGFNYDTAVYLDNIIAYNPETNTWQTSGFTAMPGGVRAKTTAQQLNGIIYVAGGTNVSGQNAPALSRLESYNISANTWSTLNNMAFARQSSCSAILNNQMYIIGGVDVNLGNRINMQKVEKFNPADETWTTMQDLNTSRFRCSTAVHNSTIYTLAGTDYNNPLDTFETASAPFNYASSGTMESDIFDAEDEVNFDQLNWEASTPASTGYTLEYRICPEITCENIDWQPAAASPQILSGQGQYFQIRADLNTSDILVSPSLSNISVDYSIPGTNENSESSQNVKEDFDAGTFNQTESSQSVLLSKAGSSLVGSWNTISPTMPTPARNAATSIYNDKIYIFGGIDQSDQYLNLTQIFDLNTNSWSSGAPINVSGTDYPRANLEAELVNNKIYLIGGKNSFGAALDQTLIYDPLTDTWSLGTPPGPANYRHQAGAANDGQYIYIFGGYDENWNIYDTILRYDTVSDTWQTSGFPGIPEGGRTVDLAENIDGRIYIAGGESGGSMRTDVHYYDITANTWTTVADMNYGRKSLCGGILYGKFITAGGASGGGGNTAYDNKVEMLDPLTNIWTETTSLSEKRRGCMAETWNDVMYVFGGRNNVTVSNVETIAVSEELQQYTLPGTYESIIFDFRTPTNFYELSWVSIEPALTTVSFDVRGCSQSDCSDGIWETGFSSSPAAINILGKQYFQYRINLASDDPEQTPVIEEVKITYDGTISDAIAYSLGGGRGRINLAEETTSEGTIFHGAPPSTIRNLQNLLISLKKLFTWQEPSDYTPSKNSQKLSKKFSKTFQTKSFIKLIGTEYLSSVGKKTLDFSFKKPEVNEITTAAELAKSTLLSFGPVCFDEKTLKYAQNIDHPGNKTWYKRYVNVVTPWLNTIFGKNFTPAQSLGKINMLGALSKFIFDYCEETTKR